MTEEAARLDFKRLFDTLPEPFMVLDRKVQFIYANPAYLNSVKRSLKDIEGREFFEVFPERPERMEQAQAAWQGALEGKPTRLEEVPYKVPGALNKSGETETRYWTIVQRPVQPTNGEVQHVILHARDVTETVHARERAALISAELNHRVRNILTIVNTIARLTARQTLSISEFLEAFGARISAMARTHSSLSSVSWGGVTMRELVDAGVEPFRKRSGRGLKIDGDTVQLRQAAAQTFSMIIHELASNAAKYGAFTATDGEVTIRWRLAQESAAATSDRRFTFEWIERFATQPAQDAEPGFGTTVLTKLAATQFDAPTEYTVAPTGVYYRIALPDTDLIAK